MGTALFFALGHTDIHLKYKMTEGNYRALTVYVYHFMITIHISTDEVRIMAVDASKSHDITMAFLTQSKSKPIGNNPTNTLKLKLK